MSSWELGAPIRIIVIAGEQGSVSPFIVSFQRTSSTASRRAKIMLNQENVELYKLILQITLVPMVYETTTWLEELESGTQTCIMYVPTYLQIFCLENIVSPDEKMHLNGYGGVIKYW